MQGVLLFELMTLNNALNTACCELEACTVMEGSDM